MQHKALETTSIKHLALRNRVALAPMTRVSTNGDGIPTERMKDYYETFATGGFGLIITEGVYTDRTYSQAYPSQPGVTTDQQQQGWETIAGVVKAQGSVPIMQLMHGGALSQHLSNTRAPSAIQPMRYTLPGYSLKQGAYPKPQAMNLAEIDEVIEGFVQSAIRAEKAGFHGVEVHSANGYLLDQFITDYTNEREDQYGGPVENRIRLTAQIISAIKAKVADDFIVGVRLSQGKVNDFDYKWAGGVEDGRIIFSSVAKAGADYIHFAAEGKGFDAGCLTWEKSSLPKLAREITSLPVIANGGLHNPAEAKRILEEGHTDIIALGTGALVNPDWPKKISDNREIEQFTPDYFAEGVTV